MGGLVWGGLIWWAWYGGPGMGGLIWGAWYGGPGMGGGAGMVRTFQTLIRIVANSM